MNKKQKIVLGVMIGVVFCIFIFINQPRYEDFFSLDYYNPWEQIRIICSLLVILIGGYLVYILKSKKEDK